MTGQPAFAALDYQAKERKTRREEFLEGMEGLIPWEKLEERVRPHCFLLVYGRLDITSGSVPVQLEIDGPLDTALLFTRTFQGY